MPDLSLGLKAPYMFLLTLLYRVIPHKEDMPMQVLLPQKEDDKHL